MPLKSLGTPVPCLSTSFSCTHIAAAVVLYFEMSCPTQTKGLMYMHNDALHEPRYYANMQKVGIDHG